MRKDKEEEYVITEREKRAWQAGKKRQVTHVRPKLNETQTIEFLELYAQMAASTKYDRVLGLSSADVEGYKKSLDVESPSEARALANKLKRQLVKKDDDDITNDRIKEARKHEAAANLRAEKLEAEKLAVPKSNKKPLDANKIRQEDADRQRKFAESQDKINRPAEEWVLPFDATSGSEDKQIDRFRCDIVYHGFAFLRSKYGVSKQQVKYEATRLGIKLNWDVVKR